MPAVIFPIARTAFTTIPIKARFCPERSRRLMLRGVVFSTTVAHRRPTMQNVSAILLNAEKSELALGKIELPEPQVGDAMVRMIAAPIHPADLNTVEGKYPGEVRLGREGVG